MGRFIAESYAPGRKIRRICSSLGTDYKIKRSDVKNVIWRDLGNGRALEVTGLDNLTEAVDGTIIVYEITTDKDLETVPFAGTPEELKALLDAGETPFVLDVREPLELQTAPFPFPVHHVPMREVPQHLDEVPHDATVVVACRSGQRSATVVQFLRKSGVPGAVNLEGGILAWSSRIDPSVPRY